MKLLQQQELVSTGELLTVHRQGELVGMVEYDWVRTYAECLKVDAGEPSSGGPILYISNLRVDSRFPGVVWELKRKLPKARWVVGFDEAYHLHAPKGVPDDFYVA